MICKSSCYYTYSNVVQANAFFKSFIVINVFDCLTRCRSRFFKYSDLFRSTALSISISIVLLLTPHKGSHSIIGDFIPFRASLSAVVFLIGHYDNGQIFSMFNPSALSTFVNFLLKNANPFTLASKCLVLGRYTPTRVHFANIPPLSNLLSLASMLNMPISN